MPLNPEILENNHEKKSFKKIQQNLHVLWKKFSNLQSPSGPSLFCEFVTFSNQINGEIEKGGRKERKARGGEKFESVKANHQN